MRNEAEEYYCICFKGTYRAEIEDGMELPEPAKNPSMKFACSATSRRLEKRRSVLLLVIAKDDTTLDMHKRMNTVVNGDFVCIFYYILCRLSNSW